MMKRITALFALLISFAAAAQEDSATIYFDKKWQKTDDARNAEYYRKAVLKNELWYVNDYYRKNSHLQMSGSYKYGPDSIRDGQFVYYHENGWKDKEGQYLNDEKTGEWNAWYESGKKRYQGMYKEGYLTGDYISWYENGNVYCTSHYLDDVDAVKRSEKTDSTGKKIRVTGKLSGTAVFYYDNGKMCAREEWKDNLVGMECWDEAGRPEPAARDSAGNYINEVLPKFDGDLMKFLIDNIKYPKLSRKRGEQRKTQLKFIVEKNGEIKNVAVDRSSGYFLLDEEARRVVLLMSGKWSPGKQDNMPVRVYYTLPVRFRLE